MFGRNIIIYWQLSDLQTDERDDDDDVDVDYMGVDGQSGRNCIIIMDV